MINKIQTITEKLGDLIETTDNGMEILSGITEILGEVTDANAVILDENGRMLIFNYLSGGLELNKRELTDGGYIDNQLNDQFKNIVELKTDVDLSNYYIKNVDKNTLNKYVGILAPIVCASKRIGTMALFKEGKSFTKEEVGVVSVACMITALVIGHMNNEEHTEKTRKIAIVKSALDTLSFSELEAVLYIFAELEGLEGLLVASKVADRVGITRSVIVNGLRKLESAGVIESRSLGMKGTYIKVMNDWLIEELNKLRN